MKMPLCYSTFRMLGYDFFWGSCIFIHEEVYADYISADTYQAMNVTREIIKVMANEFVKNKNIPEKYIYFESNSSRWDLCFMKGSENLKFEFIKYVTEHEANMYSDVRDFIETKILMSHKGNIN